MTKTKKKRSAFAENLAERVQAAMAHSSYADDTPLEEEPVQKPEREGTDRPAKSTDRPAKSTNRPVQGSGKKHGPSDTKGPANSTDRPVEDSDEKHGPSAAKKTDHAPTHSYVRPFSSAQQGPKKTYRVVSTKNQIRVYNLLASCEDKFLVSNEEIQANTGVKKETVRRILKHFERHGLIQIEPYRTRDFQGSLLTLLPAFAEHKPASETGLALVGTKAFLPDGPVKGGGPTPAPNKERKKESFPLSLLEEVGITSEELFADLWPNLAAKQCSLNLVLQMAEYQQAKFGKANPVQIRQSLTFADEDCRRGRMDKSGAPIGDWSLYVLTTWKKDNRYPRPQGFLLPDEILAQEEALGRELAIAEAQQKAQEAKSASNNRAELEKQSFIRFWASEDERREDVVSASNYASKPPSKNKPLNDGAAILMRTWAMSHAPELYEYVLTNYSA